MSRENEILARLAAMDARVSRSADEDPESIPDIPVYYPVGGGDLNILGTEALYKVISLRAWRNGSIVAVGSESGNDTLEPTWDYVRMHS